MDDEGLHRQLQALPRTSIAVLTWLLLPDSRRQLNCRPISATTFAEQLQQIQPGVCPPAFEVNQEPSAFFSLESSTSVTAQQPVIAYHGTSFENLHSILNSGQIRTGPGTCVSK